MSVAAMFAPATAMAPRVSPSDGMTTSAAPSVPSMAPSVFVA